MSEQSIDEIHQQVVAVLIKRMLNPAIIEEINEVFGKSHHSARLNIKRLPKRRAERGTRFYKVNLPYNRNREYYTIEALDGTLKGQYVWLIETTRVRVLPEFKRSLKDAALQVGVLRIPELFPNLVFHSLEDVLGEEVARDAMSTDTPQLYAECWNNEARSVASFVYY